MVATVNLWRAWDFIGEVVGLAATALVYGAAIVMAVGVPAYIIVRIVIALTHGAIPV
jgi:hypothetical protein